MHHQDSQRDQRTQQSPEISILLKAFEAKETNAKGQKTISRSMHQARERRRSVPQGVAGAGCSTCRFACSRYLRTALRARRRLMGRRKNPLKPVIPSLRDRVIEIR